MELGMIEVWLKLGEDNAIMSSSFSDMLGYDRYVISINDLNSIIYGKSRIVFSGNEISIDNSKEYIQSVKDEMEAKKKKEEKKKSMLSELSDLYEWFALYDIQVSEYNRDTALGNLPYIHINDEYYSDVSSLYSKANEKSKRIAEIKTYLAGLS